jgi:hypothetical protein
VCVFWNSSKGREDGAAIKNEKIANINFIKNDIICLNPKIKSHQKIIYIDLPSIPDQARLEFNNKSKPSGKPLV